MDKQKTAVAKWSDDDTQLLKDVIMNTPRYLQFLWKGEACLADTSKR